MAPSIVASVIEAARAHWHIDNALEITLEANPSSSEKSRFADYKQAGVNRLSLGIQSLNDKTLRFLGRSHNAAEGKAAMALAKDIFELISFDFIYAWPGQGVSDWIEELENVITLSGHHLSLYQLTIEPGTPFFRKSVPEADQDLGAALFQITLEKTALAGFRAYEISNHSHPGFESRHNLNYWEGGDYIGIGPGAHGRLSIGEIFTATHQIYSPSQWLKATEQRGHGTGKKRQLSARERAEEMIMTGLRLSRGLDTSKMTSKTGLDLHDLVKKTVLNRLLEQKLLKMDDQYLTATPTGWLVLNTLIEALLTKKENEC